MERWIVDPITKTVERITIDPTPQEFPRADERRLGQPYRYGYTVAMTDPFVGTALFKHDLEARTRQMHDFGRDRLPCEFVFVPAHTQADEDEGWLIGFVIDAARRRATSSSSTRAISRVRPWPASAYRIVPPGFHGNWRQRG